MNVHSTPKPYAIDIAPLSGEVAAFSGETLLAASTGAKVMYETRLPPVVYFPVEDVRVPMSGKTDLQTFCPFKGIASYRNITMSGTRLENAVWSYDDALPESAGIEGHVGFMPDVVTRLDLGGNTLRDGGQSNIGGPVVDWLLREAGFVDTPEDFTRALAGQLVANGIAISRMSVMVWSLHPLIAGKNYIWTKGEDEIKSYAPSYEIYDHPAFLNSPLDFVSRGLGGVRHKLSDPSSEDRFSILKDLRAQGATDYVAMPLTFSNGQTNVLTLTSDHPDGFSIENLGLIFECTFVISRFYEVFMQKENAQALLETYVGKRSGARVLGGEIRRGDGDEIDAAIMFCDLRGSSTLEQELGRQSYIDLLNMFFETSSGIVHDHGGEVLKFIGDAILAVFPAGSDPDAAKRQAVASATAIARRLDELRAEGHASDCAIGISYGSVTYGNVGSRERLDFTVIGHAANVAARLGDHGKTTGHRIVVDADALVSTEDATDLGALELRNVPRSVKSFGISACFPSGPSLMSS